MAEAVFEPRLSTGHKEAAHVFLVVEENHRYSEVVGNPQMPPSSFNSQPNIIELDVVVSGANIADFDAAILSCHFY